MFCKKEKEQNKKVTQERVNRNRNGTTSDYGSYDSGGHSSSCSSSCDGVAEWLCFIVRRIKDEFITKSSARNTTRNR
ncbi:hypothetical protein ACQKIW_30690 [Bacillus thuringiensis]|uniref:hypothetical protein n=1 Tax=Bacillus thuringiensis TaxID=1428 RepID=UPI003D03331E